MPNRDLLPGEADIDDMRRYLAIDRNSLDEEMVRQPELFFRVAEAHVLAVSRRDQLKEEYKRVDAQLYLDVKLQMAGNKTTEAHVAAEVENNPVHLAARSGYLSACQAADLWSALKEAYQQRSYVLKDLAALFAANYFARTAITSPNAQVVQESAVNARRAAIHRKRTKLRSP